MSHLTKWRQYKELAEKTLNECDISSNSEESDTESDSNFDFKVQNFNSDDSVSDNSDIENNSAVFESDFSCNSDSEVESDQQFDISAELAAWAILFLIKQDALSALLRILQKNGLRLPKDARTLLKTPKSVETLTIAGGSYKYFGLKSGITKCFKTFTSLKGLTSIKLKFNIDGIPLFKSSNASLWPTLCSFGRSKPFVVSRMPCKGSST